MSCADFLWNAAKCAGGAAALIAMSPVLGPVGAVSAVGSAVAVGVGVGGAAIDASRNRK